MGEFIKSNGQGKEGIGKVGIVCTCLVVHGFGKATTQQMELNENEILLTLRKKGQNEKSPSSAKICSRCLV